MGELQALGKVVLSDLQDFLAKAGKEELVLEEFGHVGHHFELGFGDSVGTFLMVAMLVGLLSVRRS